MARHKKPLSTVREKFSEYSITNINFRLIIYVYAVTIIGILCIGSATIGTSYRQKQIFGLIIGTAALIAASLISYKFVFKFYWIIYFFVIALLLSVLIAGENHKGATRWIEFSGIQFQPSELAKILMLVFIAMYFYKRYESINSFRTLALAAVLMAAPLILIVSEPDLSTTIVIFITFCVIIFLAGLNGKVVAAVLVIAIPVIMIFGYFIASPQTGKKILHEYQYNRIVGFFQPDNEDAKDIRYQQENSLLAIGSGGLQGKGLYNDDATSVKNGNMISEAHTDFIFTIIGEELGFLGAMAVIILIFLIVIECYITGSRAPDLAGRLFCYGFGTLIALQSFVNIAVATMLLPNTGVPLPFVSYGLTSLLSLFGGVGFVINIGLQKKKVTVK